MTETIETKNREINQIYGIDFYPVSMFPMITQILGMCSAIAGFFIGSMVYIKKRYGEF